MNVIAIIVLLVICEAHSDEQWNTEESKDNDDKVDIGWNKSPCKSEEEFYETKGMGQVAYDRVKAKLRMLKHLLTEQAGLKTVTESDEESAYLVDDVVYNEQQLDRMLDQIRTRKRRHIKNFLYEPYSRWPLPISFLFDGSHNAAERDIIRGAIAHWEANTCIRFIEATRAPLFSSSYLIFTSNSSRCSSFVGRQPTPQLISLNTSSCLSSIGTTVHEIGHAMGLYHEQARFDRSKYVQLHRYNSYLSYSDWAVNFEYPDDITLTYGVPYDYSSIMHYPTTAFARSSMSFTLTANYPMYTTTMGQRVGLSFYDTLLMNTAYCSGVCRGTLLCQRGGYTDPNDCTRCKCPDGFGGTLCERVATNEPQCGNIQQEYWLDDSSPQACIMNPPEYMTPYPLNVTCNWHITSPPGTRIEFYFPNKIYLSGFTFTACNHWVEIKYYSLTYPGPRFCYWVPEYNLTSQSNEAAVIFRTYYPVSNETLAQTLGFHLCFKLLRNTTTTTPKRSTITLPAKSSITTVKSTIPTTENTVTNSTQFQKTATRPTSPETDRTTITKHSSLAAEHWVASTTSILQWTSETGKLSTNGNTTTTTWITSTTAPPANSSITTVKSTVPTTENTVINSAQFQKTATRPTSPETERTTTTKHSSLATVHWLASTTSILQWTAEKGKSSTNDLVLSSPNMPVALGVTSIVIIAMITAIVVIARYLIRTTMTRPRRYTWLSVPLMADQRILPTPATRLAQCQLVVHFVPPSKVELQSNI